MCIESNLTTVKEVLRLPAMVMQDQITRLASMSTGLLRLRTLLSSIVMAYLVFAVWELRAAFGGPLAIAERFNAIPTQARWALLALGLVIPYAISVIVGRRLMIQGDIAPSQYGSSGLLWLQRIWGIAVFTLVAVHVGHVWVPNWGNPMLAQGVFDALYRDAGKPFFLAVYVIGVTSACFQWAQGVATWVVIRGWVNSDRWRRRWRAAAAVATALIWMIAIDVLSFFTTGARLSIELLEWGKKLFLAAKFLIS